MLYCDNGLLRQKFEDAHVELGSAHDFIEVAQLEGLNLLRKICNHLVAPITPQLFEELLRRSDRDEYDPYLLPGGGALVCYDSPYTNMGR